MKTHSRLPYLIASDGYMVTTLRLLDGLSPSGLLRSLLLDATQRLEKAYCSVVLSEVARSGIGHQGSLLLCPDLKRH